MIYFTSPNAGRSLHLSEAKMERVGGVRNRKAPTRNSLALLTNFDLPALGEVKGKAKMLSW